MGGSAFSAGLHPTAFPRIPPAVYRALKARLLPKLLELYTYVGVPREAPEKLSHGDLDFLVAIPKPLHVHDVPHKCIKNAVGAMHVVPMDGNRTSNYAIPVPPDDWQTYGHAEDEIQFRESATNQIYYQVDVHVCEDRNEWDRIMFFHSYGDLGMILGLIAKNNGLKLGSKGLDIVDSPNPPFRLSDSFDDITQFLGLSMDIYDKGFKTKREVFLWVASCRYFDPSLFQTKGEGIKKVKDDRLMYAEFVEWIEESCLQLAGPTEIKDLPLARQKKSAKVREEALLFFGKKDTFEAIARQRLAKQMFKESFNGSRVRDWAELGGNWKAVKSIMTEIRQRLGGDEGVLEFVVSHSQDELKALVLQVKIDLDLDLSQKT